MLKRSSMKTAIAVLFILGFYPSNIHTQNLTVCEETGIQTDNLDLGELQVEISAVDIDFVGCGTLCTPINGDCSHCISLVVDDVDGFCLDLEEFNTANTTNITEVCCQPIGNGADSFCGVPSFIILPDFNVSFDAECSLEATDQPTGSPTENPTENPTPNPVADSNDPGDDNTPPPTLPPFDSSASTKQISIALLVIPVLILRYL